jgi:hypothetical protein
MNETIYSIPINESFEITDGQCPVCRLHRRLTEDTLDYILGAAMMEPDVRQRTNTQGFCPEHVAALMRKQKRLPLALLLETHFKALAESESRLFDASTCYVCSRVDGFLQAYYGNILHLWRVDENFRKKWNDQEYICRPHTAGLAAAAKGGLNKKEAPAFQESLRKKAAGSLKKLTESLEVFIRSFDHRYAGEDLGEHKQAVQNAAAYLCGPK